MESTEQETVTAIFKEAGWTAGMRDGWDGKFIWKGTNVVGGIDPWGVPRTTGIVDNPNEGPTTREDAARWLVEHAKALRLEPTPPMLDLTTEATLEPPEAEIRTTDVPRETFSEPVSQAEAAAIAEVEGLFPTGEAEYVPEDETHGETGEDQTSGRDGSGVRNAPSDDGVGPYQMDFEGGGAEALAEPAEDAPYDAEFYDPDRIPIEGEDLAEPPLLQGDLGAEILDEGQAEPEPLTGQDRFIGLDDLDRRRSLRIGDVMRHARALMPPWTTNDDAALRELRNYAAAVGEGRWPYDEGRRQELDALEATLARISVLVKARDERVEFLEGASREEVETFDPEAGWPE